jgi:hypothetical protein
LKEGTYGHQLKELDLRNQKLLLVFPQYCFPGRQIRSGNIMRPSCLPQLCEAAIIHHRVEGMRSELRNWKEVVALNAEIYLRIRTVLRKICTEECHFSPPISFNFLLSICLISTFLCEALRVISIVVGTGGTSNTSSRSSPANPSTL